MKRTALAMTVSVFALVSIAGCGPVISKKTKFDWKPYDANEYKQVREGITIENKEVKELPASFYANAQACNNSGAPVVDQGGSPVMTKVQFHQPGQMWYLVSITNNTGHVVRMNSAIIRAFDPAGNQYEPLSKDDLTAEFQASWPCPSATQAANSFKLIKMLDRNAELLPDTTVTGWLAFKPASLNIPGVWKLSLYEVPVLTDDAGKVTKTTKFDVRQVVKKYEETYRQDGMFDEAKLIDTKELTE